LAVLFCLAGLALAQTDFGPGSGGGLPSTGSKTGRFGAGPAPAPPDPPPEPVILALPGKVNQIIIGGGGKYLLAYVNNEKKLVVLDLAAAKLLKEISLASDRAVIAANAEKFFVLYPEESLLQRWSLATWEREETAQLDAALELKTLAVGNASTNTPLLAGSKEGGRSMSYFIDPQTLKISPYVQGRGRAFSCHETSIVRVSGNGRLFVSTNTKSFPTGIFSLVYNGGKTEEFHEHTDPERVLTNAAGDRIYTGIGQFGPKLQPLDTTSNLKKRGQDLIILPSLTDDFPLKLTYTGRDFEKQTVKAKIEIFQAGDNEPLATYGLSNAPLVDREEQQKWILPIDQRVMLVPAAKQLVLFDKDKSELRLHPLDVDELLRKANRSYFAITSTPPPALAGQRYQYQLIIKSNAPASKFKLLAAPPGMEISADGKISWEVPANVAGYTDVIVSLDNGTGKEIFHDFRVIVGDDLTKPLVIKGTGSVAAAVANPEALTLAPAKFSGAAAQIKLPGMIDGFVLAASGRYAIGHLKDLQKLIVVDLVEGKIAGFIPVSDDQVLFAGSAKKLVVVQNEQQTLARYALPDLQREISIPLDQPIQAITMGHSSEGPLLMLPKTEYRSMPRQSFIYDLATLQPLKMTVPLNNSLADGLVEPRASADGSTFVIPASIRPVVITIDGEKIRFSNNNSQTGERMGWGVPNSDGTVFYSYARRFNTQLKMLDGNQQPYHETLLLLPATEGRLYMSIFNNTQSSSRANLEKAPSIYVEGNSRPLFKLPLELNLLPVSAQEYSKNVRGKYDRRIALIPAAKIIVSLNSTMDTLVLNRFDLEAELQAADVDYLYVDSAPPKYVNAGENWSHQVTAKSKRGGVKFRLESGPPGMKISEAGQLTWKVPDQPSRPQASDGSVTKAGVEPDMTREQNAAANSGENTVVLSVTDDSAQVILHSLSLLIRESEPTPKNRGTGEPILSTAEAAKLANVPEAERARLQALLRAQERAKAPSPGITAAPAETAKPAVEKTGAQPVGQASLFADRIGTVRTWTDADSGRTLEAKFLALVDTSVKVTKDGREFDIPLARLSRADLLWLLEGVKTKPTAKPADQKKAAPQPIPQIRKNFNEIKP